MQVGRRQRSLGELRATWRGPAVSAVEVLGAALQTLPASHGPQISAGESTNNDFSEERPAMSNSRCTPSGPRTTKKR